MKQAVICETDIEDFVKAFTETRQASGITQKELSDRTGIAQGDISKWPDEGDRKQGVSVLLFAYRQNRIPYLLRRRDADRIKDEQVKR